MSLGNRLLNLRKKSGLSQEEVADKLNVTRQTVSKWETDGSTPDFDKIIPLCELYGISTDELLTGKKDKKENEIVEENHTNRKRTLGITGGIFLFFLAVVWIMVSVAVLNMNPVVASSIFMLICAIGVCLIVYSNLVYKKEETSVDKLYKRVSNIIGIIFLIIYFIISFITMAWHLTWIIWIICGLIDEIAKLIISLRNGEYEK